MKRKHDPTNAARLLVELDACEHAEVLEFAAKIKTATALIVHPDDLDAVRGLVAVLGRTDLELLIDHRIEGPGILYAIDKAAIDPYRKATP